jgi:hypothetical protein
MSKAHILPLDSTHEGSKWIKISERDPEISERSLSGGFFWTCDFSKRTPKPVIRLFDDNVWYLRKEHPQKKGWNPDFEFTHWLKQGFYIPQFTDEELKEIEDYRNYRARNYASQIMFYI